MRLAALVRCVEEADRRLRSVITHRYAGRETHTPRTGRFAGAWLIASGLILVSACSRWGMTGLNAAGLVFGLLCWFVHALHRNQLHLAFALALAAAALKVTLAVPFIGLLFLYRHHGIWLGVLAGAGLLNVLSFLRLGGRTAFNDFQANMAVLESLDNLNTPDPWSNFSVPRLDWTYLAFGLTGNLSVSNALTLLLSAIVGLWLLATFLSPAREPTLERTTAALLPLVCLSLLVVYHHHYDLLLILTPGLLAAFSPARPAGIRATKWLLVPVAVLVAALPVGVSHSLSTALFGASGTGYVNMLFPICTTLGLAGGLVLLSRVVGSPLTAAWNGAKGVGR